MFKNHILNKYIIKEKNGTSIIFGELHNTWRQIGMNQIEIIVDADTTPTYNIINLQNVLLLQLNKYFRRVVVNGGHCQITDI